MVMVHGYEIHNALIYTLRIAVKRRIILSVVAERITNSNP